MFILDIFLDGRQVAEIRVRWLGLAEVSTEMQKWWEILRIDGAEMAVDEDKIGLERDTLVDGKYLLRWIDSDVCSDCKTCPSYWQAI